MKIKVTEPLPGVTLLKFKTQYETCATFMRLQEFYESPFKEVRGKFFDLETFMDLYAKKQGNFTYTCDWGGFNVPGHVIREFYQLFAKNLLMKEETLFDLIWPVNHKGCWTPPRDPYYVIATYDDECLDHELAHAMYYLDPEYKATADALVKGLDPDVRKAVTKWLLDKGYSKPQVPDEINAYLSTDDKKTLSYHFGKEIGKTHKSLEPFRQAYRECQTRLKAA